MDENRVERHAQIPNDGAQDTDGNSQGERRLGIDAANDGVGSSQNASQRHIGGHGATCRYESKIYQVDGTARNGTRHRVAQDAAYDEAANKRTLN